MYYPQRPSLPVAAADWTYHGASIRVWRVVGRLMINQKILRKYQNDEKCEWMLMKCICVQMSAYTNIIYLACKIEKISFNQRKLSYNWSLKRWEGIRCPCRYILFVVEAIQNGVNILISSEFHALLAYGEHWNVLNKWVSCLSNAGRILLIALVRARIVVAWGLPIMRRS